MNLFQRASFRVIQKGLYFSSFFLNFREPILLEGKNAIEQISGLLQGIEAKKLMVVTDKVIQSLPFYEKILLQLRVAEKEVVVFAETSPNPTIQDIEKAFELYASEHCEGLISIGGGSSIDFAKGIAVKSVRPKRALQKAKGILKVGAGVPFHLAIPTTSGTGSEATVACVITDNLTHEKYAINDPILIPNAAVLAPEVTTNLPPFLTVTTALDALTHAVEAFIGRSNTHKTQKMAISAIKRIHQNLPIVMATPQSYEARKELQRASYEAGVAFTRAYVGNVHALAHQLGGMYHVPHGFANAVLLPTVLRYYGKAIHHRLSIIASELTKKPFDTEQEGAEWFIRWIEKTNAKYGIPSRFDLSVSDEDMSLMAERAYQESNPLYPVPTIFSKENFKFLYQNVLTKREA